MTSSQNSSNSILLGVLILLCWSSIAMGKTPPFTGMVPENRGLVAVLPVDNLSGSAAPLREFRNDLLNSLAERDIPLLAESNLNAFLARHRVRYTGGIDTQTATALRTEEQVTAVLVVNLELYSETSPPRIAFFARLVDISSAPTIIWMKGFALAGNEHPGIFELNVLEDPALLRRKLTDLAAEALSRHLLSTGVHESERTALRVLPPKISFGQAPEQQNLPRVAVLPFLNESTRKYSSEIMLLHFVHQLLADGVYQPVEPGVIRDKMLAMRIIMNQGISLSQADLISNNLDTNFVLTGRVFTYQDVEGVSAAPSVDFSAQLMERISRRVVWTSKSYNTGDEGVWFFDWRRLYTANRLAGGMVQGVVQLLRTESRTTILSSESTPLRSPDPLLTPTPPVLDGRRDATP